MMAYLLGSYGYGNPITAYTNGGYVDGLPLAGYQGWTPVQYRQLEQMVSTPRGSQTFYHVSQPLPTSNDGAGDVHYYYGPDGTRREGPAPVPGQQAHMCPDCHMVPPGPQVPHNPLPNFFVIMGLMEFGRITMIDQNRTTPGVTYIPSQVVDELARVYSHVESSQIRISCDQGRYMVQTSYHPGPGPMRQQQFLSGRPVPPPPPPPPPRHDFGPVTVNDSYLMQKFFDTYLTEQKYAQPVHGRVSGQKGSISPRRSVHGSQTYRS